MRWLLAAAWLMGAPGLLFAQAPTAIPATPASTSADTQPALAAFTLTIDAPDEIKVVLERHLELLRYRELTDLNDSELARLITAADDNVRELVATLGYFSPEVRIEQVPSVDNATARVVKLTVAPGEPTLVTEVRVDFSGEITNDPIPLTHRQKIQDNWLLQPGARFTQPNWSAAKQQALRQLTRKRFPAGQIASSLADVDPLTHTAQLSVTLESGPAYRLGDLVISGLQRQNSELVTRLARLTPGEDYDQTQLVEAQQRLTDSGFFDSVFVSLDTAGDPLAAPVLVQLREAMLQKLVLGVGASTDSGARLSAEHTHLKVPGIGWRSVTKLLLDRETRSIGSEWTAPPNESNWRWVTSGLLQSQQIGSFDITSQRLRLGRSQSGQQIDRNYYLQYDRAGTASNDASQPVVSDSISANFAVTRRNFDSLPFPSSGWGAGGEIGGGTTLGSQRAPYGRLLARGQYYWPLGGSDVLQTNARAGRIVVRGEVGAVLARDDVALPSTQLFLTGGDNSVRGYGYRDLGVVLPDGLTTAGRYLGVASVEWQRPITVNGRLTDWESTVFVDAGSVADKPADLRAKVGVGIGARWKSPVGPLQMDLAYGLDAKRLRLHLNVGFSF